MKTIERIDIVTVNSGNENEIGIKAVATISTKHMDHPATLNEIESGGLYGIPVTEQDSYMEEVAQEEACNLRLILLELGFSSDEIEERIEKCCGGGRIYCQ